MSRLASTIRMEGRLQFRYGFVYAALFTGVMWLSILLPIPSSGRPAAGPLVLFADIAIVGFFFIAGSVFFEKGQRTLFALVMTPLRFGEYLGAKLATLTALSLVIAFLVLIPAHGLEFNVGVAAVGIILTTLLFLLVSFVSTAPFASITDWLMPGGLVLLFMSLPLIHYAGLWTNPVFYLHPTHGSLILFGAAFGTLTPSPWEFVYSVAYPVAWIVGLGLVSRRVFDTYIVAGRGGS
ncbi:fluoroquinolone transporter permease [Spiractinospora alimapuensis]|uniref:fluoroquinolone export ABC transporter permease subunit n=1 Tax=Spiractinospora alimapuensis TaxID=2820884 RepID=UPI001F43A690|nr:fluoroquinolone transporter permease [Spiractinospora alimapuensis]QVQ53802.1 fluoroquinolone transporter permease [Spiractinospora alimapuensis]